MVTDIFARGVSFLGLQTPFSFIDEKVNNFLVNVLKTGELPMHVAFIMDGNRRFAKRKGLKTIEGHEAGSISLTRIIESCILLGIKTVTIYAFSIENFNRSEEEVRALFELLVGKLHMLLEERQEVTRNVQIRIVGNRSLIPEETLTEIVKIEEMTGKNNGLILNICFSYTSRDEIAHSIGNTVRDVIDNHLLINQIDQDVITSNFYFRHDTAPVDLLIRTSGHTRLSDFLIWQVNESSSVIKFSNVYWPNFTTFHFYAILLKYGYSKSVDKAVNQVRDYIVPSTKKSKDIDFRSLPKHPPLVTILGEQIS